MLNLNSQYIRRPPLSNFSTSPPHQIIASAGDNELNEKIYWIEKKAMEFITKFFDIFSIFPWKI